SERSRPQRRRRPRWPAVSSGSRSCPAASTRAASLRTTRSTAGGATPPDSWEPRQRGSSTPAWTRTSRSQSGSELPLEAIQVQLPRAVRLEGQGGGAEDRVDGEVVGVGLGVLAHPGLRYAGADGPVLAVLGQDREVAGVLRPGPGIVRERGVVAGGIRGDGREQIAGDEIGGLRDDGNSVGPDPARGRRAHVESRRGRLRGRG